MSNTNPVPEVPQPTDPNVPAPDEKPDTEQSK